MGQDVATPLPLKDHMTQQKDVDMLIDEELALWPESGWVVRWPNNANANSVPELFGLDLLFTRYLLLND